MTLPVALLVTMADELRRLHHVGSPLVLPDAWDVASARIVVAAGFPVVATSSGAVAQTLGYDDNDSMPIDQAFDAVARIAGRVDVPVTADIEAGYRLDPSDLVRRILDAGAVGCNLEDTDHHGPGELVDADRQTTYLSQVKAAARAEGVELVLNARVDTFRHGDLTAESFAEGVRRAQLYAEAGADCVYPIRLADDAAIAELVAAVHAPVNIMLGHGAPELRRLAQLGVARVSLAGGMFRVAYTALEQALNDLRAGADQRAGGASG